MISSPKFKIGHVTMTTPLSGVVCHPWAETYYDQLMCQIWSL